MNSFIFTWENENNWIVPPISEVYRVVQKIRSEHVVGTMVVPYWPSAGFWPLLKKGEKWEYFITGVKIFEDGKTYVKQGNCTFGLLG